MPNGKPPLRSHLEPIIPIVKAPGEGPIDVLDRVADTILAPQIKEYSGTGARNPKGPPSKFPRQIAAIVYMRMHGMSNKDIAEKLGVRPMRVNEILYKARTEYGFRDLLERVEHQIIPQAVENLTTLLNEGDREATFETLKGTGVFRKHVVGKDSGATPASNALTVQINLPEGMTFDTMPMVAVGSILANPKRAPQKALPDVETVNADG